MSEVKERCWNGSLESLKSLCWWVNSFDPLGEPILTYNTTNGQEFDTPLLATEDGDFAELRPGDIVVRQDNGEFSVRRNAALSGEAATHE